MREKKWVLIISLALFVLVLAGCGQSDSPDPGQASGETCFDCHGDESKLLADLAAYPLVEKPKAESEGEG